MSSATALPATLMVALGGGAGAAARYQLGRFMTSRMGGDVIAAFPFATLAANALGSLLMGMLAGWLMRGGVGGENARLLLGVGLLGGFTTFSAFSLECVMLIERGQFGFAALYVILSLSLCLVALFLGLMIMRLAL